MKNLKRLAVILLCLVLATALFACGTEDVIPGGDTTCTEHVDADKNGKCDTCDKDVNADAPTDEDPTKDPTNDDPTNEDPTTGDDPATDDPTTGDEEDDPTKDDPTTDDNTTADKPTTDTEKYLAAIEEALKGANTVKLNLSINTAINSTYGKSGMKVNATATVAKTETGVNMLLVSESIDVDTGAVVGTEEIYIIGNKAYTYSEYDEAYIELDLSEAGIDMTNLEEMLKQYLPEGFEIPTPTEEELLLIKEALVSAFEETFKLDDKGNLVFSLDLAAIINPVLDELKAIDYEKQTIGETINKALAAAEAGVTVEDILNELATKGSLTIGELYEELDKALVELCGKTNQQIFAEAVNSEEFKAQMQTILPMLEEVYGISAEQVNEMTAALAKDGLKAFIQPEQLEITLDQLVAMLAQASSGNMGADGTVVPEVTLAQLVESFKTQILATPLIAVIGQETVDAIKNTTIKALGAELTLVLGENFKFEGIKGEAAMDVSNAFYDYDYETGEQIKVDTSTIREFTFDVVIEDKVTEIKLPEGANIIPGDFPNNDTPDFGENHRHYDKDGDMMCDECGFYLDFDLSPEIPDIDNGGDIWIDDPLWDVEYPEELPDLPEEFPEIDVSGKDNWADNDPEGEEGYFATDIPEINIDLSEDLTYNDIINGGIQVDGNNNISLGDDVLTFDKIVVENNSNVNFDINVKPVVPVPAE